MLQPMLRRAGSSQCWSSTALVSNVSTMEVGCHDHFLGLDKAPHACRPGARACNASLLGCTPLLMTTARVVGATPMLLACRSGSVQTVRTLHELNATIFAKQLGIVQVSWAGCRRGTAHVCSATGERAPLLCAFASLRSGVLGLGQERALAVTTELYIRHVVSCRRDRCMGCVGN